MPAKRVGFIVNPIAGMGGAVGLKGTDGAAYLEALRRGAKPVAPLRALEFLNSIKSPDFYIISAPSTMGEDYVKASIHANKLLKVIGEITTPTTREDTIRIAREMSEEVDLLVFVGGDGTARDICTAVSTKIPVIGVPSGVKMYSAVFAINPRAAAELLDHYLNNEVVFTEREVVDVDEETFRRDELELKIYCYLVTPVHERLVQSSKTLYTSISDEYSKDAIAEYLVETMEPEVPYILGPGSTVKSVCRKLDLNCTLLGVDVILNRKLLIRDASERDLLGVIERFKRVKVIVSPTGRQGFIFGRGNQQISPSVLRHVDKNNIIIVSTESKIRELPHLLVDTGDEEVNNKLRGYFKVLVDYNKFIVVKVE
jgi:predicted polyphosphate/ATP-dependent NAD kinase